MSLSMECFESLNIVLNSWINYAFKHKLNVSCLVSEVPISILMTIIAEFTIKLDELGIESFRKPLVIKPAIGFKCKGFTMSVHTENENRFWRPWDGNVSN
jgi:hypothetical protein